MKVEMNNAKQYVENVSPSKIKNEVETRSVESQTEKIEKVTPKTKDSTEKENERIKEIVDKLNKELETVDTSIEFKIHESSGNGLNKVSIKVVEKDSEKVIVEIPSEEAVEMAEKMEEITGILFDRSR